MWRREKLLCDPVSMQLKGIHQRITEENKKTCEEFIQFFETELATYETVIKGY